MNILEPILPAGSDEPLSTKLAPPRLRSAREFPEFPAALAYLSLLTSEEARLQLEKRIQTLDAEVARIEAQLSTATEIPQLFLVEMEYLLTMLNTELTWVKSIVDDLAMGRLTWNEEWLRALAAQFESSDGE